MGAKLTRRCLGEGLKEGEERYEVRSGRNEHGKWREEINSRYQSQGDWLLVRAPDWLSPNPMTPIPPGTLAVSSAHMPCDLLATVSWTGP